MSTEEAASEPEVLVEQRDRILIITINRPKAKNAVNSAVAHGLADAVDRARRRPGPLGGHPDRRGWHVLRRHGSQSVRPRRGSHRRGPRHGLHRAPAGQAADRRGRGLCAGRRHRVGAGHRPDRGIQGRVVRHPRGQTRAGGRRRGTAAAARAHPARDRDGVGADRGELHRRAGARARDGQCARRARRRTGRGDRVWPSGSPSTGRWPWPPPSGSSSNRAAGAPTPGSPSRTRS